MGKILRLLTGTLSELTVLIILFVILGNSSSIANTHVSGKWFEIAPSSTALPKNFRHMSDKLIERYNVEWVKDLSQNRKLSNRQMEWKYKFSNESYTTIDHVGMCLILSSSKSDDSQSGGILLIGADDMARVAVTLASSLNGFESGKRCSHKETCVHGICSKDSNLSLRFIHIDYLLRLDCLSLGQSERLTECKDVEHLFQGASVVVMGSSPAHVSYELLKFKVGVRNVNFFLRFANKDVLIVRYATLPYSKYCFHNDSQTSVQSFTASSDYDHILWRELKMINQQYSNSILLKSVDIRTEFDQREQLHSGGNAISGRCELEEWPSDSVCLAINKLYSTIIEYLGSKLLSLKNIVLPNIPEVSDLGEQRMAMMELMVLNYIGGRLAVNRAILSGWNMPNTSTITLSVTDMSYSDEFEFWYYSRREFGVEGIIIAMDSDTCATLQRFHSFLSICTIFPASLRARSTIRKGSILVAVAKTVHPSLFMQVYNLSVIFSEMDVFWKSNPYAYLSHIDRGAYDIQVSAHVAFNSRKVVFTLPKELNIGFFFVRPTQGSIELFRDLLQYLVLSPLETIGKVTFDQKLFDRFIRGKPPPKGEEIPVWDDLYPNWEVVRPLQHIRDLRWLRLPGDLFTHNDAEELAIVPQTITYHISWGVDPARKRMYCAYSLGLLPTRFVPALEYSGQPCWRYLYS